MNWIAGDRVHVTKATAFTAPGPGTVTGIDRTASYPIHVTLDHEPEPFDLIAVRDDEIETLASPRNQDAKEA